MPSRKRRQPAVSTPVAQTISSLIFDRLSSAVFTALMAALIALVGFYFTTNSTLQQQADAIKTANTKLETVTRQVSDQGEVNNTQRDKIREAFLASQTKTNEGIAKLDTRLAVAESQQQITNEQLRKIADTLDKLSNFAIGDGKKK